MKIFKRAVFALAIFLLIGGISGFFYFKNKFLTAPPNTLLLSNLGEPFPFFWNAENSNDSTEPHDAMLIPVTIPGVDQIFYMQFDTGAPSTVFTYHKIVSINEQFGTIFKIDTLENKLKISNLKIKVGTVDLEASTLSFYGRGSKIDWENNNSKIIIGTIGSDFIEKNAVILDFKNTQITVLKSVPKTLQESSSYLPFTFEGRKIFLSATLNDKPASLWYDSGSSAFELIVQESTFKNLAKPNAKETIYMANSWGQGVKVHNIPSDGMVEFGAISVPLSFVTYMEMPNKLYAWVMKASNLGGDLGGMTGNKFFLGKTLILDAPNLHYYLINDSFIAHSKK